MAFENVQSNSDRTWVLFVLHFVAILQTIMQSNNSAANNKFKSAIWYNVWYLTNKNKINTSSMKFYLVSLTNVHLHNVTVLGLAPPTRPAKNLLANVVKGLWRRARRKALTLWRGEMWRNVEKIIRLLCNLIHSSRILCNWMIKGDFCYHG